MRSYWTKLNSRRTCQIIWAIDLRGGAIVKPTWAIGRAFTSLCLVPVPWKARLKRFVRVSSSSSDSLANIWTRSKTPRRTNYSSSVLVRPDCKQHGIDRFDRRKNWQLIVPHRQWFWIRDFRVNIDGWKTSSTVRSLITFRGGTIHSNLQFSVAWNDATASAR